MVNGKRRTVNGVYLDYAAATPIDPAVKKAMEPYWSERFYNPSAIYLAGRAAKRDLDALRAKVAQALGAKPVEVVFTSGATEANNLAVQGVARQFPDGEILVSAIEHESVLEPARLFKAKQIPVDQTGRVILGGPAPHQNLSGAVGNRIVKRQVFSAGLSNLINSKTVLVSVMMVNNELGTLQPLKEIANMVAEVHKERLESGNRLPLYLHSDGAQAGNCFDLHVHRLGVDMMTINGGKIYGPKHSGVLFMKSGVKLQPQILGGGQEYGRRSGTESLAQIAGFTKALELAQANRTKEAKRVEELQQFFATELQKRLANIVINGSDKYRSPHILSVTLPGVDNERLVMELDEAGVQVGVGSACSALHQTVQGSAAKDETSHVLAAIGLSEEQIRSTLRFSFGKATTRPDLEYVLTKLEKLVAHQR